MNPRKPARAVPRNGELSGEAIATLQQLIKFADEVHATEVRQIPMITGDSKISRGSGHPEPYLTKSEVRLRTPKVFQRPVDWA